MTKNNLPSITVKDFTEIVKMQFNEKDFKPIIGLGKGGIGKTQSIEELAKDELKIGYVDIRLLLYTETDLKGIPYPDEHHISTIWLQNDILPIEKRDGQVGILVFDEITSCAKSVRTAAYQLLNERRLGEYNLPSGWMIVCLGNGEDDGGDYQGLEGNFANRGSVFNVVPDVDAWKDWAFKNNVNSLVTSYINFKPSDLHSYNPDSELEIAFASPRSWTEVSTIINNQSFKEDDKLQTARICANLGNRVGQTFEAFCKYKKDTVDPKTITDKGAKPSISKLEILTITIGAVIKIITDSVDSDETASANSHKYSTGTVDRIANAISWFTSLRTEYAVMAIKDLHSAAPQAITSVVIDCNFNSKCPDFISFLQKNQIIFES